MGRRLLMSKTISLLMCLGHWDHLIPYLICRTMSVNMLRCLSVRYNLNVTNECIKREAREKKPYVNFLLLIQISRMLLTGDIWHDFGANLYFETCFFCTLKSTCVFVRPRCGGGQTLLLCETAVPQTSATVLQLQCLCWLCCKCRATPAAADAAFWRHWGRFPFSEHFTQHFSLLQDIYIYLERESVYFLGNTRMQHV